MHDPDNAIEIMRGCMTSCDLVTFAYTSRLELFRMVYKSFTLVSFLLLYSFVSYILVYCLLTLSLSFQLNASMSGLKHQWSLAHRG